MSTYFFICAFLIVLFCVIYLLHCKALWSTVLMCSINKLELEMNFIIQPSTETYMQRLRGFAHWSLKLHELNHHMTQVVKDSP